MVVAELWKILQPIIYTNNRSCTTRPASRSGEAVTLATRVHHSGAGGRAVRTCITRHSGRSPGWSRIGSGMRGVTSRWVREWELHIIRARMTNVLHSFVEGWWIRGLEWATAFCLFVFLKGASGQRCPRQLLCRLDNGPENEWECETLAWMWTWKGFFRFLSLISLSGFESAWRTCTNRSKSTYWHVCSIRANKTWRAEGWTKLQTDGHKLKPILLLLFRDSWCIRSSQ